MPIKLYLRYGYIILVNFFGRLTLPINRLHKRQYSKYISISIIVLIRGIDTICIILMYINFAVFIPHFYEAKYNKNITKYN